MGRSGSAVLIKFLVLCRLSRSHSRVFFCSFLVPASITTSARPASTNGTTSGKFSSVKLQTCVGASDRHCHYLAIRILLYLYHRFTPSAYRFILPLFLFLSFLSLENSAQNSLGNFQTSLLRAGVLATQCACAYAKLTPRPYVDGSHECSPK